MILNFLEFVVRAGFEAEELTLMPTVKLACSVIQVSARARGVTPAMAMLPTMPWRAGSLGVSMEKAGISRAASAQVRRRWRRRAILRAYFRALQGMNYGGLLSLETHWRLEKIDEASLHLPAGHAFSHGGEAASRTCLHNLKALLETVG